ncbi:MAG: zinc ABC transporter substrate-binding protein, partial [Spirochaetaceae bacterium]|nr:zinc ABC transporter substrate-binding protein [Spirochaetaceae bacterium]
MKNTIRYILLAVMMFVSASVFAASKKTIICTTFPEYDWVLNILGNKAADFDLILLQDKGADL